MDNSDRPLDTSLSPVPIRVGIIGLGGFAGSHHKALLVLEQKGESILVCTCDPQPEAFDEQRKEWQFDRRKVAVYDHYLKMLDVHQHELDVVVIPTPIQMHFEMHRECVKRGIKVYLEKPPTLDYRELETMIESEADSEWKTQVGFNFIVQTERKELKKRLVGGEFGEVGEIRLLGMWPRAREYFTRSNWAGRLHMGDQLVLDSVIGNAMSHFVHNCLFWGGTRAVFDWAPIATLEAKVYRAHAIEGGDTFFIRATAENGVRFRMALSHAYTGKAMQHEHVLAAHAEIESEARGDFTVRWKDGSSETLNQEQHELLVANHRVFNAHCRDPRSRPTTLLSDCRPIVHLNDLAYISSGGIFSGRPEESVDDSGRQWLNLVGVVDAAREFLAGGEFPAKKNYDWADDTPPRLVTPDDLGDLQPTIERILEANKS